MPDVHVSLARAAVVHQRAEQHLDQERLREALREERSGRSIGRGERQVVVVGHGRGEAIETGDLRRKGPGDFATQQFEVVRKVELHAGKRDARAELRLQRQIVPRKAKLPQQPGQRAAPLGRVVCNGVQPDVVIAAVEAVERVQAADRRVRFRTQMRFAVVVRRMPAARPDIPVPMMIASYALGSGFMVYGSEFKVRGSGFAEDAAKHATLSREL